MCRNSEENVPTKARIFHTYPSFGCCLTVIPNDPSTRWQDLNLRAISDSPRSFGKSEINRDHGFGGCLAVSSPKVFCAWRELLDGASFQMIYSHSYYTRPLHKSSGWRRIAMEIPIGILPVHVGLAVSIYVQA